MIVEELVAALGVEVDQASINRVAMAFDAFGKGAFAMASAVAGAFVGVAAAVYATAESGDQLAATAEKLGETTDTIQELNYVTGLTDTTTEALATGLKFLAKNASEAATKGGEAAKAFAGIRLKNADGSIRLSSELFEDLADKIVSLPDAASKTALAMEVLGRSGTELLPMLNKGSAGIRAFREEARLSGYVMNTETIAAAQAFDDALKRLNMRLVGWRNRLAAPLIEKFTKLLDRMSIAVMKQGGFFEKLADGIGLMIDGLNWFLAHELAIRIAIWAIVTALVAWGISATAAAIASGALSVAAVSAAIASAAAWLAATAPLIIFAGLIALLIDDLYTFATGGKSAIGELIKWFAKIKPDDNEFIRLLKTAGALLFDLTDGAKWQKFSQALFNWLMVPIDALVSSVKWILDKLGIVDKFPGAQGANKDLKQVAPGLSDPLSLGDRPFMDAMREKFPGAFRVTDAISSGNQLAADSRKNSVMFSPVEGFPASQSTPGPVSIAIPISITVPPGTDAQGVADVVKRTVQQQWDQNMRETLAQSGGQSR